MPDAVTAAPTSTTSRAGLHVLLGALCLTLLPIVWAGRPVWKLGGRTGAILALLFAGYVLCMTFLLRQRQGGRATAPLQTLMMATAALVPALVVAFVWHPKFSRVALLASLPISLLLAWITLMRWNRQSAQTLMLGLCAATAALAQAALGMGLIGQTTSKPSATVANLGTSLYDLQITAYRHWVPRPQTNQGAIDLFADRYLLATGDGDLYTFAPQGRQLNLQPLTLHVPINTADFAKAVIGTTVATTWFRVADILTRPTPRGVQVFASHHYWNTEQRCYVMRVSVVEGAVADFSAAAANLKWSTLFESKPCVPLSRGDHPANFYGIENGGRMLMLDDRHLLLTVGDHGLNGWDSALEGNAPQDMGKSYGKILEIDLNDASSSVFSAGQRNPQGLALTRAGQLWSTEHGPQGGDELNRIERGHNYGWPVATFGVEYGTYAWPLSREPGSHEGFDHPYYTWIPSIGVSNLIEVNSPHFTHWRGDFLIGSLAGETLWRMRFRDDRIVLAEQIGMGERIRDIIEGHDGEIVLWTDSETLMFLRPASANVASGQSMFTICAGCHVPVNAQSKPIGPSLSRIVGRRVASVPGFDYSPALRAFGGSWSRERLDQFLADPAATVPGTSMHFPGISDAASREQLINYLGNAKSKLDEPPPPREI